MILLDIDGVLNPLFSFTLTEDGFTPFSKGWASWSLNSKLHAPMLESLDNIDNIVWCSSWLEESNYINVHFGLNRTYECVPLKNEGFINIDSNVQESWKLNSVKKYTSSFEGKVVWIDDELYDDAFLWANQRGLERTLLIKTDPAQGFTFKDYQKIFDFYKQT